MGMAERAPVGGGVVIYNSVVLIGPTGVVGISRKIHNKSEDAIFNDGNEIVVWETPFARSGAIICYDLCFPEVTRVQALKGAEMITMSTAWSNGGGSDPDFGARLLTMQYQRRWQLQISCGSCSPMQSAFRQAENRILSVTVTAEYFHH